MKIDIKLLNESVLPKNAFESDTGYDLIAANDPIIVGEKEGEDLWKRIDYIEYDTMIQISPNIKTRNEFAGVIDGKTQWSSVIDKYGYLEIYPRSSISKTNLVLCNSVAIIDNSFRGNIILRFRYLLQPCDFVFIKTKDTLNPFVYQTVDQKRMYRKGDRIAQAVARWKEEIEWSIVDNLDNTKRQGKGFGSSDEKLGDGPKREKMNKFFKTY